MELAGKSRKQPAFRSNWTKFALQSINRIPQREAIRRRIGDPNLEQIRHSGVLDWLPLDVHLSVINAVYQVLGEQKARAFWCERLLASFDTKLMAPLVSGSKVVYGHPVYACLKMVMYFYRHLAQAAGDVTVEQSAGAEPVISVICTDLPAPMISSPGWRALCYGQLQAAVEYAKAGSCDITDEETGPQGFTLRIRPSSRPAAER